LPFGELHRYSAVKWYSDIDPKPHDRIEKWAHTKASPKGTYQGIIPVDFAGFPIDLEAFRYWPMNRTLDY